jgi:(2R)-3-sulfolactate dehydrogenase (NADP+)
LRVDARNGFAYPAVAAGIEHVHDVVATSGMAAVAVANSHHLGMVGYHIEPLAERGLLALAFTNSPAAIAPWGGNAGVFGTNPIALAAPREHDPPLVIDLSMAQVARGKIMMAASRGESIPEGWALDADGQPTTDAAAALAGTMMPMGGRKGAVLALLIELLAAGLTGSQFGHEAGSFFTADGPPPGIGHLFVVFDPLAFSSRPLAARVDQLAAAILAQPGTRLPGNGRLAKRARARREGVQIARTLLDDLRGRAGYGRSS